MKLGRNLKFFAQKNGLRQVDLCKMTGITKSTMNGYFNDYREPDVETLKLLARLLNTTVEELIGDNSADISALEQKNSPILSDEVIRHAQRITQMPPPKQKSALDYLAYLESQDD